MGVASGCGEQEVGVASGSGWNLWVWLLGVFVRRYIDFLILLIPTPLVFVLFYSIYTCIYSAVHQESRKCNFFHQCTFSQSYFMLLTNKTYQHDSQSLLIN